jgi:hypothetical protein
MKLHPLMTVAEKQAAKEEFKDLREKVTLQTAVRGKPFWADIPYEMLRGRFVVQSRLMLVWWSSNGCKRAYPNLQALALKYGALCVSVTPVDRYFSELKHATREVQAREKAEHLELRAMLVVGRRDIDVAALPIDAGEAVELPRVSKDLNELDPDGDLLLAPLGVPAEGDDEDSWDEDRSDIDPRDN